MPGKTCIAMHSATFSSRAERIISECKTYTPSKAPRLPLIYVEFAAAWISSANNTHNQYKHKPHRVRTQTFTAQSAHKLHPITVSCRPNCRTVQTGKQTAAPPLDTKPHTPHIHHQTAKVRWIYIRLTRPRNSPVGAPHQAWEHRALVLCTTPPNACDFH